MKIKPISGALVWLAIGCILLVFPSAVQSRGICSDGTDLQPVPALLKRLLTAEQFDQIAASPCRDALAYLIIQYHANPDVPKALDAVLRGLQPFQNRKNPWQASDSLELLYLMVDAFLEWCVFLPQINGSHDNGLKFVRKFSWFYYRNPAGQYFVDGKNPLNPGQPLETGANFFQNFTRQRGAFMDSPASLAEVPQWIDDPRIEISDYQKQQADDYDCWNAFFARELMVNKKKKTIPSRPDTMPERDYIVVAPTDCQMAHIIEVRKEGEAVRRWPIEKNLQLDTLIDVKGIMISVGELLAGVPERYKNQFVGGTGQACILTPDTYHHFHAPVNGTVVHAAIIKPWPSGGGNSSRRFLVAQRGVIVIEVTYADLDGSERIGYVALLPVGLETIGSVVLNEDILRGQRVEVKRGFTELGNFYYGGSLVMLLYSKGLAGNPVRVRMGNQINLLQVGTPPRPN